MHRWTALLGCVLFSLLLALGTAVQAGGEGCAKGGCACKSGSTTQPADGKKDCAKGGDCGGDCKGSCDKKSQ